MRLVPLTVAALSASALSAFAEPWIDYALLLETHRDEVTIGVDAEGRATSELQLGDVMVTCVEAEGCYGVDRNGAVGCLFSMVAELRGYVSACGLEVPSEARAVLEQTYERVGRYVAANAVPLMEWSELDGYAGSLSVADGMPPIAPSEEACREVDSIIGSVVSNLQDRDQSAELDQLLSVPRLPVMNPCL